MREEERARREIEQAKKEAEKEENRYLKALEKAQIEKSRAISRAQITKSGHVYIISNIGSFGEKVYKIGMTRRLDPMDRVKELGDASVPFRFKEKNTLKCLLTK